MMEDFLKRVHNWNTKLNDIPRRLTLIALVLGICFVVVKLLPLCWPFVLALLFAMLMEPLVRRFRHLFAKMRIGNRLATIMGMVIVFGLLGWGIRAVAGRLLQELVQLAKLLSMSSTWQSLSNQITGWINNLNTQYADILPVDLTPIINDVMTEVKNILMPLANQILRGALTTAKSVPAIILSVVLTIMGTYYLSSDRERIFAYFHRTFPAEMVRKSVLLKRDIFKALFGQIRAQLLVSLMITIVVMLGLVLQQEPYWLLVGFLIGLADALPVLGAGLFLIPWSVVGFVMGNTTTGIGMALLYLAVVVVRQIAEPRIVGKSLGLYPLATMMAMFAGLQITGNVLGLLLGPILLNLLKVVLRADSQAEVPPVSPRLKFTFKRRVKDAPAESNVPDAARREE
jgi:sporulation integral membrane protein YtvI